MIISFTVDHERVLRNVVRMFFVYQYHYTVFILDEIRHFMSIPNSQKTRLESFMEDFQLWNKCFCNVQFYIQCQFSWCSKCYTAILSTYSHAEGFFKFCFNSFWLSFSKSTSKSTLVYRIEQLFFFRYKNYQVCTRQLKKLEVTAYNWQVVTQKYSIPHWFQKT